MAYFFNTPDFYDMRQASNAKFEKQIDDFVQSGPLMQWARYQQAKKAEKKEAEREAEAQRRYEEERDLRNQYMQMLAGNRAQQTAQGQPQQPAWDLLGKPYTLDTAMGGAHG